MSEELLNLLIRYAGCNNTTRRQVRSKNMKRWVTRDKKGFVTYNVYIWATPGKINDGLYVPDRTDALDVFEVTEFRKVFGWTPKKGSCEQIEIIRKGKK